jgi:hypothetical protein
MENLAGYRSTDKDIKLSFILDKRPKRTNVTYTSRKVLAEISNASY